MSKNNFIWNPESRSYVDFDSGIELKKDPSFCYHYQGSDGNTYFLTSTERWLCIEDSEDKPRKKK
jgi:hypothetical protein